MNPPPPPSPVGADARSSSTRSSSSSGLAMISAGTIMLGTNPTFTRYLVGDNLIRYDRSSDRLRLADFGGFRRATGRGSGSVARDPDGGFGGGEGGGWSGGASASSSPPSGTTRSVSGAESCSSAFLFFPVWRFFFAMIGSDRP